MDGKDNPENNAASDATITYAGKTVKLSVRNGFFRAAELQKVGLATFDPGFTNTAMCESQITFIDGEKGHLLYRGYPIEELAERSSFMEVSFLLLYGELPSARQLAQWEHRVMRHTFVHQDIISLMQDFRYDAHPMGMLVSAFAAMGTLHPEANPALQGTNLYESKDVREKQVLRVLGKMPTVAAIAYRHRAGRPYNNPAPAGTLSYTENFLMMLDRLSEADYRPHPKLAKALDTLFILHADHELNCSTAAMRHLASSGVDLYTSISGSAGALYGPLHGGATEAVLRMLERIDTAERIPNFLEGVKSGLEKLMGFGHRVYKAYDPRARIIRKIAYEVFDVTGSDPLIDIAVALEKAARADDYFVKRNLYPNVDFYSGLIYKAMGFPTDYFPVLFAIGRTPGWLAHWMEFNSEKSRKIARPKQVYTGHGKRDFLPVHSRPDCPSYDDRYVSAVERRMGALPARL